MAKVLQQNHIALTSSEAISEICKPLKELFNITSFNYIKIYSDGSRIQLMNNANWIEHFYNKAYYQIGAFEKNPICMKTGFLLWSALNKGQQVFQDARDCFYIDNGITIVDNQKIFCEFYYFGSTPDNTNIINFYINNIDLLKRFILYFKDKAAAIIKIAEKNRIILPVAKNKLINQASNNNYVDDIRKKFIKATTINKYKLNNNGKVVSLTFKELMPILLVLSGKTAKEAAKQLNISHRTIEDYMRKIKLGFNCTDKAELLRILLANGIDPQHYI